jgi:hypothetical protein
MEINGKEFQIGRLSPMNNFHVLRRLQPVVDALQSFASREPEDVSPNEEHSAIMNAFGKMSEEDVNYIFNRCLSVVRMKAGLNDTYSNIWANGQLMFQKEVTPLMMMRLVMEVVQHNAGDFSEDPPSASAA